MITRLMRPPPGCARSVHALTFVCALVALVLQFTSAPPRPIGGMRRASQLVEYFTVDSLFLLSISTGLLAFGVGSHVAVVRRLRYVSVVSLSVTTTIYATMIHGGPASQDTSPLGAHAVAHYALPVLAVGAWCLLGPRGWVDRKAVMAAIAWPVCWLCAAVLRGSVSGYYPYRFMDPRAVGYQRATGDLVLVLVVVVVTAMSGLAVDSQLSRRAPASSASPRGLHAADEMHDDDKDEPCPGEEARSLSEPLAHILRSLSQGQP